MYMSENINELAMALSKAQGQIKPAIKDKKNPHFKSSYADLASTWDACRSALSDNGLSVMQTVEMRAEGPVLMTMLVHSSGQWKSGEMPIIVQKSDAQGFGSALTYARRYSLQSIAGIASEDDDGEGASKREATRPYQQEMPKPEVVDKLTASELLCKLQQCSPEYQADLRLFCKKNSISEDLSNLPLHFVDRLTKAINKKLEEFKASLETEISYAEEA